MSQMDCFEKRPSRIELYYITWSITPERGGLQKQSILVYFMINKVFEVVSQLVFMIFDLFFKQGDDRGVSMLGEGPKYTPWYCFLNVDSRLHAN